MSVIDAGTMIVVGVVEGLAISALLLVGMSIVVITIAALCWIKWK